MIRKLLVITAPKKNISDEVSTMKQEADAWIDFFQQEICGTWNYIKQMPEATLREVRNEMNTDRIDEMIVVFIGHGGYLASSNEEFLRDSNDIDDTYFLFQELYGNSAKQLIIIDACRDPQPFHQIEKIINKKTDVGRTILYSTFKNGLSNPGVLVTAVKEITTSLVEKGYNNPITIKEFYLFLKEYYQKNTALTPT